jgi:cytochrome c oxidase subunit 2
VNDGASAARGRILAAGLSAVALGGCAFDGPQSTVVARSDFARDILGVYAVITWAAVGIAAVVFVVLGWVLWRYRARPDAPLPRQTRGHTWLEIGWTVAPALVLLVIAVPTLQVIFRTQGGAAPGALTVVVRGWQWWWEIRYPDLGVVTANELHLPLGRPAVLQLEGADVIHSLWVPQLGGKRDVVPGRVNRITLTPEVAGEYLGQCAEFCGPSHANMRLRVVVQPAGEFERWVATQRAPAAEAVGPAAEGQQVYARSACVGCHTVRGLSAGVVGPDLTHFGSRRTVGAGLLPATPENVAAWVRDPAALKPGVKMPALGLSEAEARAVAAYLLSLR